ncbi:MAG: hypothetical protein ACI4P0_02855 [Mailhella sp.]
MFYLGVDPSISNTGMVLLDDRGKILCTVNGRDAGAVPKRANGFSEAARYAHTADFLFRSLNIPEGEEVRMVYEDYAYDATHRAFSLGEFGGVLKGRLMNLPGARVYYAAPMAVKKFATGNGGAGKGLMVAQAVLEAPLLSGETDDVCDAFFMAKMALYLHDAEAAVRMDTGNSLLRLRLEMTHKARNSEDKA